MRACERVCNAYVCVCVRALVCASARGTGWPSPRAPGVTNMTVTRAAVPFDWQAGQGQGGVGVVRLPAPGIRSISFSGARDTHSAGRRLGCSFRGDHPPAISLFKLDGVSKFRSIFHFRDLTPGMVIFKLMEPTFFFSAHYPKLLFHT